MAKATPHEWLKEILKSHSQAKFPDLGKRGCNTLYSKNQHGQILGRKTAQAYSNTAKQRRNRNRFCQCVQMWKALTDPQKILFEWRETYFPDMNFEKLRYQDMFTSLCLRRLLWKYLKYTLEVKITLEVIEDTEEKAILRVKAENAHPTGDTRRWMYEEGSWSCVELDRFHLAYGSLKFYFSKISPEISYHCYVIDTQFGLTEEQYYILDKQLIAQACGRGTYIVMADHEGLYSNTIEIEIPAPKPLKHLEKFYLKVKNTGATIYGHETEWTRYILNPYPDKQVICIFGFEDKKGTPQPDFDFQDVQLIVYDLGWQLKIEVYGTYGAFYNELHHSDYGKICDCSPLNRDKPFEEIPPKSELKATVLMDKNFGVIQTVY